MVDAIDRESEIGFEVMMLPSAANQKYQIEMSEDELTMAIGRTVKSLFSLLSQTQPQPPQMVGVVVIKEKAIIEPEIVEEDVIIQAPKVQEPEVALEEKEPIQEEIKVELPPKPDRNEIEQKIVSYQQFIGVLSQAITDEQRRLKTQEQVLVLRNVNRSTNSSIVDSKKELIQRIDQLEQEKQVTQKKMDELKQSLQDI